MKLNALKNRLYQIEQELGVNNICVSYKNSIIYLIVFILCLYLFYKCVKYFCFSKEDVNTKHSNKRIIPHQRPLSSFLQQNQNMYEYEYNEEDDD